MVRERLSLVVPFYNEERVVRNFLDFELLSVLKELGTDFDIELVLVDDGSTDNSLKAVKEAKIAKDSALRTTKIVSFSRNFGKEVALSAGIKYATGDAVIMIDADGQHPSNQIPKMVRKWKDGAKVVIAVREQNETKHKFGSKMFYSLMKILGVKTFREGELDFRLIDREVADAFNDLTEHNRITRGLIDWLGFSKEYIPVKLKKRQGGQKGTYSFGKLIALAGDSFASMSRTPLMIFGGIGFVITAFSFLLGLFILVEEYILGDPLGLDWSGAVAVSIFVAFLVGLVLISQSITAIYISQIHSESKNRPLFIIDKNKSKGIKIDRN